MANNNLTIDLQARTDAEGRIYYVGKIKAPVLIDLSQGCAFLIFCSDPGNEVLQIAHMNNRNNE